MKKILLVSIAAVAAVWRLAGAELPGWDAEASRKQAAVELVVDVLGVTDFKDDTLIYGGYACASGRVRSVRVKSVNAKGQEGLSPRRKGDKVSVMLDCQPDDVPFGPGQAPKPLCSAARKAGRLRFWSSRVDFPQALAKGCEAADLGFEIVTVTKEKK